jgi:hypothetical protein
LRTERAVRFEENANDLEEFLSTAIPGFQRWKKKRQCNRKMGAKFGHKKQERAFVEQPDKVLYALVDNCQTCHINLLAQVPTQVIRRQITELPEIKPVVIETQQYEVI